ncbi:hypothetical protein ACTHOQ_11920 [Solibacillus silvestris]|uniref:hypothetical protein n=1 Tax=Solibacillus silvestris TaxID=76853 RepID=UPI003F7F78BF
MDPSTGGNTLVHMIIDNPHSVAASGSEAGVALTGLVIQIRITFVCGLTMAS